MSITSADTRSTAVVSGLVLPSPSIAVAPTSPDVAVSTNPIPRLPTATRSRRHLRAKRALDVVVAALAFALLSPILVLVALAVLLHDRGPVLFRQQRVGKDGIEFSILKFRTMSTDAEARLADLMHRNEGAGPLFKLREDPRVTRVGAFLRKTSIDELPQLWNVLVGDMSLVGPRPALPREVEQWDAPAFGRLTVQPGITGAWQVNGRSDLSWDEGLRHDLDYAANWTLGTDLVILARTVPRVLFSRGAY
jgi:lipopolysaccharide/colanic/teichoic acid biosynthesis glycosyltransferase